MFRKPIVIVSLFIVALLAAITLYFLQSIAVKQNLHLSSDKSADVVEYLQKEGVKVGTLDELFLSFTTKPIKGWIYLNKKSMPRFKFLLLLGRKSIHYAPVTIVPGETSYFVLENLAKKLKFDKEKLEKSYRRLAPYKEGNILADTYNIPIYFDENRTVKFLLESSMKKYKKLSMSYYNDFNTTAWKRIVTIASIVQKEAANRSEMPIVASVIFNRLHKKMRLQMDGTLNYGAYSHTKVTPLRIKNDKSSYNTYKHKGLPKEPVCNVSIAALKAAIVPAKSNYLYFMKSKNGIHNFSVEYKTHIKNVQKRREEGRSHISK